MNDRTFHRMSGNIQLIGLIDDLVIVYNVNDEEDVVYRVWECEEYDECGAIMKVLK